MSEEEVSALAICSKSNIRINGTKKEEHEVLPMAGPIIVTTFILIVVLLKVSYEHLTFLPTHLPESNMLLLVGIAFGAIMKHAFPSNIEDLSLSSEVILLCLLPPIILDAAYTLNDQTFFEVTVPVMIFAFVGTIANFVMIGIFLSLMFSSMNITVQKEITTKVCFLYSSLIVAVDPVAVLAIFHELGVNERLYFLVFGESLLNDAVTVVLFNSMQVLMALPQVTMTDLCLVVASLFTVSIGGVMVGVLLGLLSCIFTKYTDSELAGPMIIIAFAYLAYLVADVFKCSGMISLITCGILQAIYAFKNLSPQSRTFVKSTASSFSVLSEECIFLYLGFAWFQIPMTKFNLNFSITALIVCLLVRFIVIYSFSFVLHRSNVLVHEISFTEQFILAYGGLRGAVSFALAMVLDPHLLKQNNASKCEFLLATMFIIFVTVVPMGLTIKPIVKCMHIAMMDSSDSVVAASTYVMELTLNHVVAGMEVIIGRHGFGSFSERVMYYNEKFIRPFLQKDKVIDEKLKLITTMENIQGDKRNFLPRMSGVMGQQRWSQVGRSSRLSVGNFVLDDQSPLFTTKRRG